MKSIFSDETFNKKYHLGAVNSINWARILAQITYYFHSYFSLLRQTKSTPDSIKVQFVVPTGNFGDILAGYYAKKMGLPISKLVVATNANDILDRFFKSGRYEKKPVHGQEALGGEEFDGVKAHVDGAKETLSPAMDILVSSNFERLLWYLAREQESGSEEEKSRKAGGVLKGWMDGVKSKGGIAVSKEILQAAQRDFASYRVSDEEVFACGFDIRLILDARYDCRDLQGEQVCVRSSYCCRCQCSDETRPGKERGYLYYLTIDGPSLQILKSCE